MAAASAEGDSESMNCRKMSSSTTAIVKVSALGWAVILAVLTASLVGLPLILPPLQPPPVALLFFPVGIMAALMCLAFSPSASAASRNVAVYCASA